MREQKTVSGRSSQTGLGTASISMPATTNLPFQEQLPLLSRPFRVRCVDPIFARASCFGMIGTHEPEATIP